MSEFAISARNLGKSYRRGTGGRDATSLREMLFAGMRDMWGGAKRAPKSEMFWALRDASFDIKAGENVGIIGLNGAGKSTLLKMLSRITTPSTGTIRIRGRLGALLEVGTGFHGELTGKENIFLYGSILGMSREDVARQFDAIVDFSELADFVHTPVKRYSSGMYVRLAFAVAAHLDPDILLLDEVLAVGDFSFQRKCMDFARKLEQSGSTILFVSHNMFSIKSMCQRVIYLKQGVVDFDGPTEIGLKRYEEDSRLAPAPWFRPEGQDPAIKVDEVDILGEDGTPRTIFSMGERMRVRVKYTASRRIENPNFLFSFTRYDNVLVCNYSSSTDGLSAPVSGSGIIELRTPPLKLVSDLYTISIVVRENGFRSLLAAQIGGAFHVRDALFDANAFGVFHESGEWRTESVSGHPATPPSRTDGAGEDQPAPIRHIVRS